MDLISICILASAIFHTLAAADPRPTPTTALREDHLERAVTRSTNYFSIYETPIPNDSYYMGVGRGVFQNGGTTDYWVGCTDQPYTVSAGYAGCGSDDLYTRCAGNVAKAKDGTDITCRASLGYACITAAIHDDLDVTTYASWIMCGLSGYKTNLVRTPTGRSTTLPGLESIISPSPTSSTKISAAPTTRTAVTTISIGSSLIVSWLTIWASTLATLLLM